MNKERGMTLTEVMISVGILMLISGIAAFLYLRGFRLWKQSSTQTEIQQQARIALDNMVRNLQEAQAYTLNITYYTGQTPILPYTKLTFTNVNNYDYEFYQYKDELHQRIDKRDGLGWREYQLTKNIQNVYFYYPDTSRKDLIAVSITVEKEIYETKKKTMQLIGKAVQIRNP